MTVTIPTDMYMYQQGQVRRKTTHGDSSNKQTVARRSKGKGLTIGEGLGLARGRRGHVLHCSCAVGGPHCGLSYFYTVGVHDQVPVLVGADPHGIPHTQPIHLGSISTLPLPVASTSAMKICTSKQP